MKLIPSAFFYLSASLASVLPASATSVVCIRTPDSIVIAADSMLAVRGADNSGKPCRECKIIQAGGIFFSMTGFVKDPVRPYDAVKIIGEMLKGLAPRRDPVNSVAEAVTAGLKDELRRLKGEAPELYNRYMRYQKGTLLKVLLAGFEKDTPMTVLLGFRQAISPYGEITITAEREACPGNCDPARSNVFILGDRRPIDSYLKKNEKVDFKSTENAAKFLVDLVIAAHMPDVGPPVDVLRIDANGARWIERKEECPKITAIKRE